MIDETTTKKTERKKAMTVRAATRAAVAEVLTWPGEFSTDDVIRYVRKMMHVTSEAAFKAILSPSHRHKEHVDTFLTFPMREWTLVRLRKTKDKYKDRVFICYRIAGQKRRHWMQQDLVTVSVMDYVLSDRVALIESLKDLPERFGVARPMMVELGPDATYGDVKDEVMRRLGRSI